MDPKKDLILTALDHGDNEVGIGSFQIELNLHDFTPDKDTRMNIRESFAKFAIDILDMGGRKLDVWYSDECSECGKLLDKSGKCWNKVCWANPEEEEKQKGQEEGDEEEKENVQIL